MSAKPTGVDLHISAPVGMPLNIRWHGGHADAGANTAHGLSGIVTYADTIYLCAVGAGAEKRSIPRNNLKMDALMETRIKNGQMK